MAHKNPIRALREPRTSWRQRVEGHKQPVAYPFRFAVEKVRPWPLATATRTPVPGDVNPG